MGKDVVSGLVEERKPNAMTEAETNKQQTPRKAEVQKVVW